MHFQRLSQRAHWETLYYLIDAFLTSFLASAMRNSLTFSKCILDVFRCKCSQIAIHIISKSYLWSLQFKSTIMTSKLFSSFENVQLKLKEWSILSDKDVVDEEEKSSFNEKRLDKEELRRLEYVDNNIDQENVHQNLSQWVHEEKMLINLIESSQLHCW